MIGQRAVWFLVGAGLLAAGCSGEDNERLARLGRKLSEKAQGLPASAPASARIAWPTPTPSAIPEAVGLAERVRWRVRQDRYLAELPIEVTSSGMLVQLSGTVRTPEQRQRALDLARSTVGVADVADSLTVTP
jgi:hypothetical protein